MSGRQKEAQEKNCAKDKVFKVVLFCCVALFVMGRFHEAHASLKLTIQMRMPLSSSPGTFHFPCSGLTMH